jgi:hypothetical protein
MEEPLAHLLSEESREGRIEPPFPSYFCSTWWPNACSALIWKPRSVDRVVSHVGLMVRAPHCTGALRSQVDHMDTSWGN